MAESHEPHEPTGTGRHAQGTWTPEVRAGSGGRRRWVEDSAGVTSASPTAPWVPSAGSSSAGSSSAGEPSSPTTTVLTFPLPDGVGASPHLAARAALRGEDPTVVARSPIRRAPLPGVPRRPIGNALWGPPIPAAGR